MVRYLILQNPGHNRVYYNSADKLALAELKIACDRLEVAVNNASIEYIKGVRYLLLEVNDELKKGDIDIISRLSFVFAMYKEIKVNDDKALIPIEKSAFENINGKISTLLKYQGKTNELFTKMMVNVALLASDFNYSDQIQLLDPVSGKGTTLFEAAIYGFSACGIEIEQKSVHDAGVFFKKYLEEERYKHEYVKRRIAGDKKLNAVFAQEFAYAKNKTEFKDDSKKKLLSFVNGKSQDADKYFKKETFHLIVGDLPYGIFHGNTGDKKSLSPTRNPSELLEQCALAWYKCLKKGGVVVMAWNAFVATKHKLTGIIEQVGFKVIQEPSYHEFEHMVDKSIKRDIIVAKKT